jgi:hypothetical protein
MADDPTPHLRVLIADENQRRIAEIASVISGLHALMPGRPAFHPRPSLDRHRSEDLRGIRNRL